MTPIELIKAKLAATDRTIFPTEWALLTELVDELSSLPVAPTSEQVAEVEGYATGLAESGVPTPALPAQVAKAAEEIADFYNDIMDARPRSSEIAFVESIITRHLGVVSPAAEAMKPDAPMLGLATTTQLLDEIKARVELRGGDFDARTVDLD